MAKNNFKYRCEDCGTEQFHNRFSFTRAARVRCVGCGSTRLDEVTPEATNRRLIAQTAGIVGVTDPHEIGV